MDHANFAVAVTWWGTQTVHHAAVDHRCLGRVACPPGHQALKLKWEACLDHRRLDASPAEKVDRVERLCLAAAQLVDAIRRDGPVSRSQMMHARHLETACHQNYFAADGLAAIVVDGQAQAHPAYRVYHLVGDAPHPVHSTAVDARP